jgi:hypothetical protein
VPVSPEPLPIAENVSQIANVAAVRRRMAQRSLHARDARKARISPVGCGPAPLPLTPACTSASAAQSSYVE